MFRRIIITIAALVAASALLPATPAQAKACDIDDWCTTTWYSDASHTTVVGGRQEYCGGFEEWGVHTSYLTYVVTPC